MGSFAEPCTDDMDPFMNTWTAACMPIVELFPNPVCGSPNPAGWQIFSSVAEEKHWIVKGDIVRQNQLVKHKLYVFKQAVYFNGGPYKFCTAGRFLFLRYGNRFRYLHPGKPSQSVGDGCLVL